jgi:phosphoglycolate phosphatase-like HAD superfamily hydrolase
MLVIFNLDGILFQTKVCVIAAVNHLFDEIEVKKIDEEVLKRANIKYIPKYGESFMEKYIHKYIPTQKKYLEECEPEQRSDIVINNQDYFNSRLQLRSN